jgi:hypothetical protein
VIKESLKNNVRSDSEGGYLRGSQLGVKALRKEARDLFSDQMPVFAKALKTKVLAQLQKEGGSLRSLLENTHRLPKARKAVFDAIRDTFGMRKRFRESIALLQHTIRPILVEKGDPQMREKMTNAFVGIVGIGLSSALGDLGMDADPRDDDLIELARFLQKDMNDNIGTGKPWSKFLAEEIENKEGKGWNAMIAPLEQK